MLKTNSVKFAIISAGRTGSGLLQHLLGSHPDILCFPEMFEKSQVEGLMKKGMLGPAKPLIMNYDKEAALGFENVLKFV